MSERITIVVPIDAQTGELVLRVPKDATEDEIQAAIGDALDRQIAATEKELADVEAELAELKPCPSQ